MIRAPFIIFSVPRCGSTALLGALNLIPGVHAANQPRFDDIQPDAEAVFARVTTLLSEYSGFEHVFDPIGYPFRYIDWATIEEMEQDAALWAELNSVILNYPGVRIVFLRRRSGFQRIVSELVARTRQHWGYYKTAISKVSLEALDEDLVRWYLENTPRIEERLRNAITTNPVFDVSYEEFLGSDVRMYDRIERFREIVDFLQIKAPADVFSSEELALLLRPSAKLNDADTFDRIPNYRELCKKLAIPEECSSNPAEVSGEEDGALTRWRLRTAGETVASMEFLRDQPDTVRIVIAKTANTANYDVQLNLLNLKLVANHSYELHFRARSDHPRNACVGVAQAHDPWMGLGLYEAFELSQEWRDFQIEFSATADEDYARIHFDLGDRAIPVEISLVSLRHEIGGQVEIQSAPHRRDLDLGVFRRLTPISSNWGFNRGTPIDRYYVEGFLARHASDIRGRVLEIEEDAYTCRFGGEAVTARDVLHITAGNPGSTIVADLTDAGHIPSSLFDCLIVTETLQYIYDVPAAVATLHRILKPGGVLLATFPGITRTIQEEWGGSWLWRFTTASAKRLFEPVFGEGNVEIQSCGNVLAAISFLHGLAKEDLNQQDLDYHDPDYEVKITVRAVKPALEL